MNETALGKYYDFYAIDEYYCEDDEVLPRPPKVISKPCGAKFTKAYILSLSKYVEIRSDTE